MLQELQRGNILGMKSYIIGAWNKARANDKGIGIMAFLWRVHS
jgi:hypothetical protein